MKPNPTPKPAGILRPGRRVAGLGRRGQAPIPYNHDACGTPVKQVHPEPSKAPAPPAP